MTQKVKKIICLALVACMVMTCFSACGSNDSGSSSSNSSTSSTSGMPELDEETNMTISIMYWDDEALFQGMEIAFEELHPNIDVQLITSTTSDIAQACSDYSAANTLPDCLWYVNEIDTPIYSGYWQDMTVYFENDSESSNLIKGIVEYEIGYFGTDYKFCTPMKWFPDVAWVNKQFFEDNSLDMPSTDWTWEEFETVIEEATMSNATGRYGSKQSFGLCCTGGCYPVTWYCLAADDECIAEFGWTGSAYHMDNWAVALNKQASYLKNGWLIDDNETYNPYQYINTTTAMASVYGEEVFAQDAGYVAIRADKWWCWQYYWNNEDQGFLANNVIFVPYIQPHVSTTEGKTNISTMDMGGIGQSSTHPREAYEVLKYFDWGVDGWLEKIDLYTTWSTEEMTNQELRNKQIDCPTTLDDTVWDKFMACEWFPQEDDELGRYEYFQACFSKMREKYWTALGATIIPGFNTWLTNIYQANDSEIERSILYEGADATQYVDSLEESGLESYTERHEQILELLSYIYG